MTGDTEPPGMRKPLTVAQQELRSNAQLLQRVQHGGNLSERQQARYIGK